MSGIICAIRGGVLSQSTIQRAIIQAKQTNIPIYFLYVVNLDFLEHSQHSRTQVLKQEIRSMGEYICLKAQIEAKRDGTEAFISVREGKVTEEIIALSHEIQADYVVLGRPQGDGESNQFDDNMLNEFGLYLESQTGAEVIYAQAT